MKNAKIVLVTFLLLFITGIAIAGGLTRFDYDRSLTPTALNRNFETISQDLNRLRDMVREQEHEIRRLRSKQSRLRYYIVYLYESSTKEGVNSAEDWRRSILSEVENANRDLGIRSNR